jgi:hypothetical protein
MFTFRSDWKSDVLGRNKHNYYKLMCRELNLLACIVCCKLLIKFSNKLVIASKTFVFLFHYFFIHSHTCVSSCERAFHFLPCSSYTHTHDSTFMIMAVTNWQLTSIEVLCIVNCESVRSCNEIKFFISFSVVTAVQCPLPDNPRNGKAIYTSVSYNSVVSYECQYGYTLVGESSRRCGADKKWSGSLPQCREINCGHPGTLYNGWLEQGEVGFGLGARIIFRCQPEMMLVGNSSTVCQIDGKWRNPLPLCLAPCVVPTVSQGIVVPIEVR